jgi:Rad4 beta-hairpin domain 3
MSCAVTARGIGSVEVGLSRYSPGQLKLTFQKGEQPIKHANTTARRQGSTSDEEDDNSTPLYSELQTEIYVPPPVENGIVPKNAYGNIDVYTPSMVPAGGEHVVRPSIAIAAQFAGIDYADAVVGFDFVRNRASTRLNGIVVAKENAEGLLAVWEGMMERVEGEAERRRVTRVLERWRRFFVALGIRRRLEETHGKLEAEENMDEDYKDEDLGGGFLLGAVQDGRGFTNSSDYPLEMNVESTHNDNHPHEMESLSQPNSDEIYNISTQEVAKLSMRVLKPKNQIPAGSETLETINHTDEDTAGGFEKDDLGLEEDRYSDTNESGGGFIQGDEESDDGGFIYEDEDGIL